MAPTVLLPRGSAISGSHDFLARQQADTDHRMLLQARDAGIQRGVALLSRMDMDVEGIAWAGAQAAGQLHATYPQGLQGAAEGLPRIDLLQSGLAGLEDFVKWVYGKVEQKIGSNEWLRRVGKTMGIAVEVVLAYVKEHLLQPALLKDLLPGFLPVKALVATGVAAWSAWSDRNALHRIEQAGPQIGSGVPQVMFQQFSKYLSDEIVANALKSGYTFGKTLASVLLTIFAAPLAGALALVTDVVDAVCAFVHKIFQAFTFRAATKKCREWVKQGDVAAELDFSDGIAGCPFIGCLFFGAANYIGHFNLTAMLTRPVTMNSANLMHAVSEVSAVQRVACRYVTKTKLPFKFTNPADEWIGKMMAGMADETPRLEFVSDDASKKTKWFHYGRLYGVPAAKKVGGLLLRGLE